LEVETEIAADEEELAVDAAVDVVVLVYFHLPVLGEKIVSGTLERRTQVLATELPDVEPKPKVPIGTLEA